MNMTLSLNAIAEKWLDVLKKSKLLEDYCQKHYHRSPKFFIGADPKNPPQAPNCPYIMIIPTGKSEWMEPSNTYKLLVVVVISQKNRYLPQAVPHGSQDGRSLCQCLHLPIL